MNIAVPPCEGDVAPEIEVIKPLEQVWATSFEETPQKIRHRYFDEKGNKLPEAELLRIEEVWAAAVIRMAGTHFR